MTSAKICLTSEKILLFCNLGESPSLYEIMIVIHVLLETNVYVSETSPPPDMSHAGLEMLLDFVSVHLF